MQDTDTSLLGLILMVILFGYVALAIRRPRPIGGKMDAAREAYVQCLISDSILDGIDTLYETGEITNAERYTAFKRLSHLPGLRDFLPSDYQEALKQEIRLRLSELQDQRPLPFPDRGVPYALANGQTTTASIEQIQDKPNGSLRFYRPTVRRQVAA